ncbi:uncharacterized protein LOC113365382 [Ctenocephalides felis]|nr:uncharacterized protein LOC113365382 [Ctenocephalides felis]
MDCARKGYYTQFCDIYEHSLQDVGVGGFNGIKRYYNHFVIDYETRVYKKCVKARQDLLTLIETPPKPPGTRRRRKQSLEETTDHDFTFGYGSNLESFIPSVASSSTSSRNEVPVLHLPEDDSSYVGDNLYELIPDVEITDGGSNASGTIGGDAKSGAENAAQAGSSGLMGMEMTSERGHTEDSTTGYYDVEDLSNY